MDFTKSERNLTMLTDFYEITMANGYFKNNFKDTVAYFDMFFRKVPGRMNKFNAPESPFFFIHRKFYNTFHPDTFSLCIFPQYPERDLPFPP